MTLPCGVKHTMKRYVGTSNADKRLMMECLVISEFWSFLQAEVLRSAGKCVTVHIAKLQLKNDEGPEMAAYTEEKWLPLAEIPLTLALVTCFQKGTAILRPNAFQVMDRDGRSKVNLHCDDQVPHQLREWTNAINERIRELTRGEMEQYNATLEENEQVRRCDTVVNQLHTYI